MPAFIKPSSIGHSSSERNQTFHIAWEWEGMPCRKARYALPLQA